MFSEDFNGSSLDSSDWAIYDTRDTPTKERMTPDAVRVAQGELDLVGGLDSSGLDSSGGVASTYDQLYGRWEVRFREDRGAGYAAGVLLWPKTERWPMDGEIDEAEIPDGSRTSAIETLHLGPDAQHNWQKSHGMTGDFSQWHTVAVDWLPDHITFWLDGMAEWTEPRGDLSGHNLVPATSPMHLALQQDLGCGWIQCRDAQTPPYVVMHIDSVRIYGTPRAGG